MWRVVGTKAACQDPPSDSARGREADQKFLSGLYKVQALHGGLLSCTKTVWFLRVQNPWPGSRVGLMITRGRVRTGLELRCCPFHYPNTTEALCPCPRRAEAEQAVWNAVCHPLSPGALYWADLANSLRVHRVSVSDGRWKGGQEGNLEGLWFHELENFFTKFIEG